METLVQQEGAYSLDNQTAHSSAPEEQINNLFSICLDMTQNEIKTIKQLMDSPFSLEETDVAHILKLLKSLEHLQIHLDFTYQLFKSNSKEEFQALKERFNTIAEEYTQLNSHADLNIVMLEYVLEFLKEKLLVDVKIRINKSIQKLDQGIIKFEKNEINTAWLDIMAYKLEITTSYYARVASFSKNDLYSTPKSSPIWQDLQKYVTVKKPFTTEELHLANKELYLTVHIIFAVIKSRTEGVLNPNFSSVFSLVREAISHKKQPERAEILALKYLSNPNTHAFKAYTMATHPWLTRLQSFGLPSIGYDKCIYIPRLFPIITKELILDEYKNNTINKLNQTPLNFEVPNLGEKNEVIKNLFLETPEKINVRVISPIPLALVNEPGKIKTLFEKTKGLFSRKNIDELQPNQLQDTIIIFIHGGGWASGSSVTYRPTLYKWAKTLNIINFSIDYRLSPNNKYPDALDDTWQAYLWILNYAQTILGIDFKKIILVGDSAGGNLVMALTLRLIKTGMRIPDGLFLIYPGLDLCLDNCSPSYLHSVNDMILPHCILKLFVDAYVPEECKVSQDPFLSPLVASDELLTKLPPIRAVVGTGDPLHDNTWKLIARLMKLNKEIKAIVYEDIIHGFYSFAKNDSYEKLILEGIDTLKELIH